MSKPKEEKKQCPICKLNIPKQAQVCPLCKADLNVGTALFTVVFYIVGIVVFIIVATIFYRSCSLIGLFK